MKGQIEIPFMLIIVTLVLVVGILAVPKFLTGPITDVVRYDITHDNSYMALISVLSSTKDGKDIQEMIGEHLVYNSPNENTLKQTVKEKTDKLLDCYKLSTPSKTLAYNQNCEAKDYKKEAFVALPFNTKKLTEKLTLVIN